MHTKLRIDYSTNPYARVGRLFVKARFITLWDTGWTEAFVVKSFDRRTLVVRVKWLGTLYAQVRRAL